MRVATKKLSCHLNSSYKIAFLRILVELSRVRTCLHKQKQVSEGEKVIMSNVAFAILGAVLVLVGARAGFLPLPLVIGLVAVGTILVIYNLVAAVREYRDPYRNTITQTAVINTPQGPQLVSQPVVVAPPVSTQQGVISVAAPVGTPTVTPLPVFAPSGGSTRPPSGTGQQTTEDAFKQWLKDNGDPFIIAVPTDMPPPPDLKPPVIPPRPTAVTTTPVKETTTVTTQTLPAPISTRPPTTVTTVTNTKPTTADLPSTVTSQSTSVKPPKAPGASPTQVTTTTTTVTTPSSSGPSGGPVAPSVTGSKMTQKQAQEMLDEHNKRRANVGKDSVSRHMPIPSTPIPPLEWDADLANLAQQATDNMLASGSMFHNTIKFPDGRSVGQNISWAGYIATAPEQVSGWYDSEIPFYHYDSNECIIPPPHNETVGSCGHSTQVLWKDSIKMGCGVSQKGDNQYWACDFLKPGNYGGRKPY